jgi:hypothetical protein
MIDATKLEPAAQETVKEWADSKGMIPFSKSEHLLSYSLAISAKRQADALEAMAIAIQEVASALAPTDIFRGA